MLKIDLHIHSIHSGHAYGSIYDILKDAASKKMNLIAITDHGPSLLGSAQIHHFRMGDLAPRGYKGVKLLWGCEANIIDKNGNIDLDDGTIKKLDILLVGIHLTTPYKDLGKKANTKALISCFKKYPIHVFAHPGTLYYDFDLEKVFQAACDENLLLELNLAVLRRINQNHYREKLDYNKKIIEIAKKNKKKIIVNSDAHFLHQIGDDSLLKKYWRKLGLTKDMVINNFPEELEKFLESKKQK